MTSTPSAKSDDDSPLDVEAESEALAKSALELSTIGLILAVTFGLPFSIVIFGGVIPALLGVYGFNNAMSASRMHHKATLAKVLSVASLLVGLYVSVSWTLSIFGIRIFG